MGQFFETLPVSLVPWLLAQKVLWIASAPLAGDGHVNVSPKGISDKGGPFFGVIKEPIEGEEKVERKRRENENDKGDQSVVIRKFWYMDLTGSGIETTSHLHEPGNGRITVLFNAFEGPPRILRIFGKGNVLEYGSPAFHDMVASQKINIIAGTRSIIVVDIHQVGTSCGFSVPFYEFVKFRPTLNDYFEKRVASEKAGKKEDGIERYWAFKNAYSMDGLPGMRRGLQTAVTDKVNPIKKMVGPHAPFQPRRPQRIFLWRHMIMVALLASLGTAVLGFALLRLCMVRGLDFKVGKTRLVVMRVSADGI